MAISDEEIVARVQQGDAEAFEELFERHYQAVWRYLAHSFECLDEADDAAAEVFVRAYQGLAGFQAGVDGGVPAFLVTIARNLARDANRRLTAWNGGRKQAPLPDALLEEIEADAGATEEEVLRDETIREVHDALRQLPREDCEVILLSYERELSAREIMALLGKPSEAAVRAHLYRALKRLRSHLQQSDLFAEMCGVPEEGVDNAN